ncbi:MAG: hypothetical protein OH338_02780, partial [Candidatus Parvarchaeota archaeon]|nr:hypothetical protein [Candidatus Parvarchaeum tengchongense]
GFKENQEVEMEIDSERRELLRRHHTATHIINQACRRVLGEFVYQNGAEKDVDQAHLDITYFDRLNEEQVNKIERLANEVVSDNMKIKATIIPRERAESKYGMSIYQGGVVPNANIRIVKIDDYDVEACGGLHCNNTGEVGLIKIVKTERIQDGVVRIVFKAYKPALEYIEKNESVLQGLSKMWGVNSDEINRTAERIFNDYKRYKGRFEESEFSRIKEIIQSKDDCEIETKLEEFGVVINYIFTNLTGLKSKNIIIKGDKIGIAFPNNQKNMENIKTTYPSVRTKGEIIIGSRN